jgi:ATP-dependent Clp protease ATP-binding subunit ClpX
MKKNGSQVLSVALFCNKDQNDVRGLIAGPTVFICDACRRLQRDIIADDRRVEDAPTSPPSPSPRDQSSLDEYVISQDTAKKKLAVAVYNHYKRIRSRSSAARTRSKLTKSTSSSSAPPVRAQTLARADLARLLSVPFHHRRRHHPHRSQATSGGRREHHP